MWQKTDPRELRVGFSQTWPSEWFGTTQAQWASFFVEDIKIRNLIEDFYFRAGIAKTVIRKTQKEGEVLLFTAKPAVVLGKEWVKLAKFEKKLMKITKRPFKVTVRDLKKPELSAKIMAEFACIQLESRMPYRRVAKTILQKVMEKWAIGVKVQIGGRLNGADMSRTEKYSDGRIPLQTIRADVDYHHTTALTKYWVLWVKVWICKAESTKVTQKKVSIDRVVKNA